MKSGIRRVVDDEVGLIGMTNLLFMHSNEINATAAMILCVQQKFPVVFMPPTKTTCTAANAVLAA